MSIDLELKEKLIAQLKTGEPLKERSCSMCGYMMKWFYRPENEQLYYDSGCDCVSYHNYQPRQFDDLDFYLIPEHGHIDRLKAYIEAE